MGALLADMERELGALAGADAALEAIRKAALEAVSLLGRATRSLLEALATEPERAMAVSVPYLKLCGYVIGGWLLAKSAAIANPRAATGSERDFYAAKVHTAAFYAALL